MSTESNRSIKERDPSIAFAVEYIEDMVGSDPDGWDKHMTEEELEHFMAFGNSDRSIETVSFAE